MIVRCLSLLVWSALLMSCGGRPDEALSQADNALASASMARKCAPQAYAAAERMYKKALAHADAGRNDEARAAARAAQKLAAKARDRALARKEACDREDRVADSVAGTVAVDPEAAPVGIGVGEASLKTVYFDYNAFELTPEARRTLEDNAAAIRARPQLRITLEGHCDKRGSTEFNLALGEKRAKVVRRYLLDHGLEGERLAIISYGEEALEDLGDSESAHARNRRVQFSVR